MTLPFKLSELLSEKMLIKQQE